MSRHATKSALGRSQTFWTAALRHMLLGQSQQVATGSRRTVAPVAITLAPYDRHPRGQPTPIQAPQRPKQS
jgi:hypothetical protein